MNIFGRQVSVVVFISGLFSTVATVSGAVTTYADTFGGSVGRIVASVITGVGILGMAWTAQIHTIDTSAGQPAIIPAKPNA